MRHKRMGVSRRRVIATGLGITGASFAGCLGNDGGNDDGGNDDGGNDDGEMPGALTFAGGGEGGAWSLGMTIWAEFAGELWSDVSTTARDGAGEGNIIDVADGNADIGVTFSNALLQGYNGEGEFPREFDELRAIAAVWPSPVMSLAAPEYETYADLAGAAIAPGEVGFSGYSAALMLLDYYDVSEDDVDIVASGYSEMPSLYQDGAVDSIHVMGSMPHTVPEQGLSQRDGRMLSVSDDVGSQIVEEQPGWTEITIPAGMFEGAVNGDQDIMTAGTYTIFFTREDMSEEVVYELTKKNFEEQQRMIDAHSVYEQMTLDSVTEGIEGFPLHPGAERALEELDADL